MANEAFKALKAELDAILAKLKNASPTERRELLTKILRDGSTCLDHYKSMIRMEQDRLFIRINPALMEEVENSPLFHSVSPALHEPVPGYVITESFKTLDHYGNLQLTFQRKGGTGGDYLADVDIDDAQGIEHVFQVLRNSISGPTNPYDIHDILVTDQDLDPGYSFVFAQPAALGELTSEAPALTS